MHVDVAVADAGLDGGNGGVADDGGDEARAAARDHHIDQAAGADQRGDGGSGRGGEEGDRIGGDATGLEGLAEHGDQGGVRRGRRAGTAEQHGIAGLEGQSEGVDGDVRPRLVDDADDAERHGDLPQLETVGQGGAAQDGADRIGQSGHLTQPGGDAVDAGGVERQAIDERLLGAGGASPVDVLGVRCEDALLVREQRVGRGVQGGVLLLGGQGDQLLGRGAGGAGRLLDRLRRDGEIGVLRGGRAHGPRIRVRLIPPGRGTDEGTGTGLVDGTSPLPTL